MMNWSNISDGEKFKGDRRVDFQNFDLNFSHYYFSRVFSIS